MSITLANIELYGRLLRSWLASTKINGQDCVTYAIDTVAALLGYNLSGPIASLAVSILEGIIEGGQHHDATTDPATGLTYPAGPAVTPAHAVALAVTLAQSALPATGPGGVPAGEPAPC